MIRPEDAWGLLEPHLAPLEPETIGRRRAAGRVLAEGLDATLDVPGEDVSAVDGYALTEAPELGRPIPVAGTIAAGDPPGFELPAGAAARIMTGAPVPAAARLVMMVEASDGGRGEVRFHQPAAGSDHIRRRGEILRQGDQLLAPGSLLTPGALALLATHGCEEVPVHRVPRVAVLATGDEVVPPDRQPRPGQLRDSHTDFLLAAGAGLGLSFHSLGIAPDRVEELSALVARGLESDVLLLCGGVSMGEYDLVEDVLGSFGCRLLFDSVAVQPGKPLVAAVHQRGLVFGLPGNPASVMVGFWLFVRPALRRLSGAVDGFWRGALEAELAGPLPAAAGRDRFLPARVSFIAGRIRALPESPQGSHDLAAYALGTALVRVRAGSPARAAGERCELLPLADWRGEAELGTE